MDRELSADALGRCQLSWTSRWSRPRDADEVEDGRVVVGSRPGRLEVVDDVVIAAAARSSIRSHSVVDGVLDESEGE